MKIVLGCYDAQPHPYHEQYLDGGVDSWLLTDANPRYPNIEKMDARSIPYSDVEAIYASHVLEHIRYDEVLKTLKHWHSVLETGGWVQINVPDIEWALDQWMRFNCGESPQQTTYFKDKETLMQIFDGDASTDWDTHKSWFTVDKLERYLNLAGFSSVEVRREFEAHDMMCVIGKAVK